MRDNRSLFLKECISACVIEVIMGVDNEAEWFICDAALERLEFFLPGERTGRQQ
jgi:hypothetical protein